MKLPQRSTRNLPKLEFEVSLQISFKISTDSKIHNLEFQKTSKFRDQSSLSQLPPETYKNLTTFITSSSIFFSPLRTSFFLSSLRPPSPRTNVLLEINDLHSRLLYFVFKDKSLDRHARNHTQTHKHTHTRKKKKEKKKKKKKEKEKKRIDTGRVIDVIIIRIANAYCKSVFVFLFLLIEAASRF